ncbi:MAG: hypothetical protein ABIY55_02320 [Kofleriaceae bacterium]
MGTLRVRFVADVQADARARILTGLRKLKATVRNDAHEDDQSEWRFDTLPLAPAKPSTSKRSHRVLSDRAWAQRYRARMWAAIAAAKTGPRDDLATGWHDAVASWNGDLWTRERITRAEALAAAIAIARSCAAAPLAPFPTPTKGRTMTNTPNWTDYDRDLRELYAVAADLIAGRSGPEEYRARGADPRLLMPAFGRTPLIVGVWNDDSYGPLAAMCVASFILYGTRFEDRLARMGITGDLVEAYTLLEQHCGPRVPSLESPRTSTTSLAKALETPRAEGFLKLTVKKPTAQLGAPRRTALADHTARPALPDLGGRS